MDIYIKIGITICLSGLIVMLLAFPGTKFANLGKKKFGDYSKFLDKLMLLFIISSLIFILIGFWRIN